jgi:hypothetical protein
MRITNKHNSVNFRKFAVTFDTADLESASPPNIFATIARIFYSRPGF